MSITQTYYLAHKARAKLSREAAQSDHDLRLLVGHANLLDSLMMELAEAEREQERWFNQSVRGAGAAAHKTADRRVQWADRVEEEAIVDEYDSDDSSSSDSDSDDEYGVEDVEMMATPSARIIVTAASTIDEDDEEMGDDLEEDYAQLELVRTPSHSTSPPELVIDHDSDDASDDEAMPLSPADAELPLPAKEAKQSEEEQDSLYPEQYYVSRRTPAGLVSAISVY